MGIAMATGIQVMYKCSSESALFFSHLFRELASIHNTLSRYALQVIPVTPNTGHLHSNHRYTSDSQLSI